MNGTDKLANISNVIVKKLLYFKTLKSLYAVVVKCRGVINTLVQFAMFLGGFDKFFAYFQLKLDRQTRSNIKKIALFLKAYIGF